MATTTISKWDVASAMGLEYDHCHVSTEGAFHNYRFHGKAIRFRETAATDVDDHGGYDAANEVAAELLFEMIARVVAVMDGA